MDVHDPREIAALRSEVEQAVAALDRVNRELASLEANLVRLGSHRRTILRERAEITRRLSSLRSAAPPEPTAERPERGRSLAAPVWVHATEEQAIVFTAGRTLRRLLGDID